MSFKAYDEYKDSGVEWLGRVPAHWPVSRLKNSTVSCQNGVWGDDPQGDINDVICVRVADFDRSSMTVDISNPTYRNIRDSDLESRLVEKGDLLLEKSGGGEKQPVGFVCLYEHEAKAICANFIARIKLAEHMSPSFWRYVHAAGYSIGLNIASIKQTSGIQNLDQHSYLNESAAYPTFKEQTTIAAFLDRETARIDALIEEQQRLIALLKEKRQAVISHAVTKGLDPNVPMKDSGVEWLGDVPAHWEVIAIKWLSIVQRGASPRPINDPIYFDDNGEYSWVRIADVSSSNGSLNYTPQKLSKLGSSMSVKINPGELFVSIAGTVGKPCISKIKACIHDGFVYFPQLKIPPRFLYTIFESGLCYKGLGKMGTQLNLNTDTIGGIKVAIPPSYDEITQILDSLNQKLKNIDDLASQAGHVTSLLQERRSALISAAVTGKIDVRDWQPPKDNQTAAEPAEASA